MKSLQYHAWLILIKIFFLFVCLLNSIFYLANEDIYLCNFGVHWPCPTHLSVETRKIHVCIASDAALFVLFWCYYFTFLNIIIHIILYSSGYKANRVTRSWTEIRNPLRQTQQAHGMNFTHFVLFSQKHFHSCAKGKD